MAASKSRVKVEGVREVRAALKALEANTADLKAIHTTVARGLLPGIASRTPIRTGRLAGSWGAGATKTRARLTSSQVYAGPIEYGWAARNIAPAAMVAKTIEAEQGEIISSYEREIEKTAERIGFETKPA